LRALWITVEQLEQVARARAEVQVKGTSLPMDLAAKLQVEPLHTFNDVHATDWSKLLGGGHLVL